MHEIEKIDYLAHLTKGILELLPIEKMEKELRKLDVDAVAFVLKQCVASSPAGVQQVQAVAQMYNLERVVVFPCIVKGEHRIFFRMYGGSIPSFCKYLGIQPVSESTLPLNPLYIAQMEYQYGVVLYEQQHRK